MIYNVTSSFTKLRETSGTIQNNSAVYDVEISNKAEAGSGIILPARNVYTFSNQNLYVRCATGGWAEIRVVPFVVNAGSVIASGASSADIGATTFNTDDLDDIFKP